MGDITVYKLNEYEWWASKLSIEETEAFYEKEIGEENDIEDIEECNIDKEGMWWEIETGTKEHEEATLKLNGLSKWKQEKELTSGDLMNDDGTISKWITFREAIERSGEYCEPFCIASTEW
jgi:hypothetical protein